MCGRFTSLLSPELLQVIYVTMMDGSPLAFAGIWESWKDASRPTALRHDTAEAIMIGLWGLLHLGWLDALPKELQR